MRLKKFLEMRGADGGSWRRICGLPALWTGIYYDQTALDAAWDLVKDWTAEDHLSLRRDVPRLALKTPFKGQTVRELAIEVLKIARLGLQKRAALDRIGGDESGFLNVLQEIAQRGVTPAEEKLALYQEKWNGSVDTIFTDYAY